MTRECTCIWNLPFLSFRAIHLCNQATCVSVTSMPTPEAIFIRVHIGHCLKDANGAELLKCEYDMQAGSCVN